MNDELEIGLAESVSHALKEGGSYMYPLAAFAVVLPLIALGLLAATLIRKRHAMAFALVTFGLVGASVGLGALGVASEARKAKESFESSDPEWRTPFLEKALASSQLRLRHLGLTGAMAPTFLAFVLLGLGLSRSQRFQS